LIAILPHNRSGRLEPNPHRAALINIGALSRDPLHNIFCRQQGSSSIAGRGSASVVGIKTAGGLVLPRALSVFCAAGKWSAP